MKTIKRNVLVVVFMLGTLFNYANNENNFYNTANVKKVKVVFEDVKKGQVLTVKDNEGFIFYSETVSNEGELIKYFDLSSLNDGIYTVELNKESVIEIQYLKVKNNKVSSIENSEKVVFKPIIRIKENLVLISKIDFDKNPLKISLSYQGEIILSETIKGDLTINRIYKLDKKIKGDYKVVVYSDGKNFVSEFKL